MGASAYHLIQNYSGQLVGNSVVEIGSSRGEGSTEFLMGHVGTTGKYFYTVDVRQDVVDFFNGQKKQNVQAICCETIDFVEHIKGPISFCYMDSFDYIPPDDSIKHAWMQDMIKDYQEKNPNDPTKWLTNENSARHHLERTIALLPLMSKKSIFLFDDTFMPSKLQRVGWFKNAFDSESKEYNEWFGKGATAVPYLIGQGWKVMPTELTQGRDDYTAVCNFI